MNIPHFLLVGTVPAFHETMDKFLLLERSLVQAPHRKDDVYNFVVFLVANVLIVHIEQSILLERALSTDQMIPFLP